MNIIFNVIIVSTKKSLLPGYKQFTFKKQQSHQLHRAIMKFFLKSLSTKLCIWLERIREINMCEIRIHDLLFVDFEGALM